MIDIRIAAKDGQVFDSFDRDDCTLKEVSSIIYRLEQIKLLLLSIEFDSDLEVHGGDDGKSL